MSQPLFLQSKRPISYTRQAKRNVFNYLKHSDYVNYEIGLVNYARFLACGNINTPWFSTVRRAAAIISCRCSRKYLATSALANWLTASFHSTLAAFSRWAPLSRDVNSKSHRNWSEHSNSVSIDGSVGSVTAQASPLAGLGQRALVRQVLK